MNYPKVSIVTVTFNCSSKIEKTLCSVISQTYPNIEYIIIDGASTDNTLSIIEKYKEHISLIKSESDKGIFDAMNKGIDAATGDWINFMNAGDVFDNKSTIEDIFPELTSECSVLWGISQKRLANNKIEMRCPIPFYEQKTFVRSMGINHQAVFVNLHKLGSVRFNLDYRIAADYNMLKTMYDEGHKFLNLHKIVAIVEGDEGFSATNRYSQKIEEAKICGINHHTLKFKIWIRYWTLRQLASNIIKRYRIFQ